MANPQKENGFTPIAHTILENLGNAALLGSEYQVVICVLRKTYGYGKKEDWISLTQFEKFTGLSRPTVVKTLKNLVARNILVKSPLLAYKFNKDWDSWVVKPPLLVKSKHMFGKPALTKSGKPALTHNRKKIITIDNNTGKQPTVARTRDETSLILEMFNKTINPTLGYANTTQRKAVDELIKLFGFEKTSKAAEYAISVQGEKYAPTITTPYQLKTKLAELRIYFEKQKGRKMNVINLDNLWTKNLQLSLRPT